MNLINLSPKKLRLFKFWLGLGLLYVVFIFYYSLIPHPPLPIEIDQSDKFYHFTAYGLLIFWFCQVFEKKSYPFLTTIFILQGVVIEVLQNFTTYRTLELGDILANTGGVISLLLFAGKHHQLLEKLEQNYLFKKNTKSKTVN